MRVSARSAALPTVALALVLVGQVVVTAGCGETGGASPDARGAGAGSARPGGFDSDGDGMPNEWETAHELNPNAADNNGDADLDGYTNLEEYLNEIAAWPAVAALIFTGEQSQRYAEIQNWNVGAAPSNTGTRKTAYWQPSRYDVAVIRTGTARVDAVGQHAGSVRIEAKHGAVLDIGSGWLDVVNTVSIGGRLNLSGGALRAQRLEKSARSGVFAFTGGSLSAAEVEFDLVNRGGTLAPGNGLGHGRGIGTTSVSGDLVIESGVVAIELADGASDSVRASGSIRLGGELRITEERGFIPQNGTSWTIAVSARGVSGHFERVPSAYSVDIVGHRVVLRFGEALESIAVSGRDAICSWQSADREPT